MTAARKGDRVQVTFEGIYDGLDRDGDHRVDRPDSTCDGISYFGRAEKFTIKTILAAEPPMMSIATIIGGSAAQRLPDGWNIAGGTLAVSWARLNEHYGPITLIHTGDGTS